jgi:hypothetical protein
VRFAARAHEYQPPSPDRFILLRRPAVLSIRVEDPDGRAIQGVRVQVDPTISDPPWTFRARGRTDEDGRVPAIAVPAGSLMVGATPPGRQGPGSREPLTVAAGEHRQVRLTVPHLVSGN